MLKNINYSLYFVTPDSDNIAYMENLCLKAAQGGADIIQLRYKKQNIRHFLTMALKIKKICVDHYIPLIINDRIDITLACQADGVHLGQSDMPIAIARKILGDKMIIGLSIEDERQIYDTHVQYADYLAVSPVFATDTKKDIKKPLGLKGLEKVVKYTDKPIIAIGGIKKKDISSVMQKNAKGIAVVSAISEAPNVVQATYNLKQEIKKWQ